MLAKILLLAPLFLALMVTADECPAIIWPYNTTACLAVKGCAVCAGYMPQVNPLCFNTTTGICCGDGQCNYALICGETPLVPWAYSRPFTAIHGHSDFFLGGWGATKCY